MDFDLFDLEDDDLMSSVCMLPPSSEHCETINISYPEFNCTGEDTLLNLSFPSDSFVKNSLILNHDCEMQEDVELSSYEFKKHSDMSLSYLFNKARMDVQQLVVSLNNKTNLGVRSYYETRHQVTLLLHTVRNLRDSIGWHMIENHLQSLRNLLNRIGNKELFKLIFLGVSVKGNETDSSIYNVFHGYFEWRLLDLVILKNENENEKAKALFRTVYARVLEDLLQISIALYGKKNRQDLINLSPFPCLCIKESWLLLQLISENVNTDIDCSFWKYFNEAINILNIKPELYSLTHQSIPEFTIWLLKGLVQLQGYKPNGIFIGKTNSRVIENFDLLENIVDQYFNCNPSEENCRIFLCNLMPILLEWWPAKVDTPMLLWEYFNKKLNSSFFIAQSAPSNLAVTSGSGKGYVEKIRSNLDYCKPDSNLSSFSLYTIILGKILNRFFKQNQTNQMQKILGRIFSKFSPAKFLALNETGIHHLIELFLTLALCGDFHEIAPKIKDKFFIINLEKITLNRQLCITKGHIALLLLFVENNFNITEYVTKLLEQLNSIKMDLNIYKIIADGMYEIFLKSENFDQGEHLLIDSWLVKFLNGCTQVEQERTLQALHVIFEKLNSSTMYSIPISGVNYFQIFIKSLNLHILPFVKQNFVTTFSQWIPKLAADFCISSNGNDASLQFQRNFKYFIESNCCDKQATLKFLLEILESDKSTWVQASTIIQIWLKCLVLLTANNEDVVSLAKIVVRLPDFQDVCNLTENDLIRAKEPLCVFVSAVGNNFESCVDFQKKCLISDKFNSYLIGFEKWLSDKNLKTDTSFRFYSFIAIVIFNCANIVYARSKITCFFHVAITRFIIPATVQMGKAPEPKLIQIIHKVWPVLVQGIGKLNFKTDQYISKTLTDLIVKWIPHFKVSQNPKVVARPFVNCMSCDNYALSAFVFEKLTSVFLAMQRRQADPNACLVITIFQEVVDTITDNENKLKVFLNATCFTILEHLMMVDEIVPSRVLLFELLKKIVKSPAFTNSLEIRELIIEQLKIMTVKHLSYFTLFYFELLTKILKLSPQLVISIMEFLNAQIKVVEAKRGVGEDNRLRNCMATLKGALIAVKSKI